MQFFLSQQVTVFWYAILCGLIIGVLNEPFRFLRYSGFNSKIDFFIQDMIFMIISAFITFFFSLCYNKGDVRFFILVGELCGFCLFRYTVGLITGKLFYYTNFLTKLIFSLIKKFFSAILAILTKLIAPILAKIPLFNKTQKTPCHKSKIYCIISKSAGLLNKVFIKR